MQKFVITLDGELRFGDVKLHKNLLPWGDDACFGGGMWKIGGGGAWIDLYGYSLDFGAPDFEQVRCIDWSGVGGVPIRLRYLPEYPNSTGAVDVIPFTEIP